MWSQDSSTVRVSCHVLGSGSSTAPDSFHPGATDSSTVRVSCHRFLHGPFFVPSRAVPWREIGSVEDFPTIAKTPRPCELGECSTASPTGPGKTSTAPDSLHVRARNGAKAAPWTIPWRETRTVEDLGLSVWNKAGTVEDSAPCTWRKAGAVEGSVPCAWRKAFGGNDARRHCRCERRGARHAQRQGLRLPRRRGREPVRVERTLGDGGALVRFERGRAFRLGRRKLVTANHPNMTEGPVLVS